MGEVELNGRPVASARLAHVGQSAALSDRQVALICATHFGAARTVRGTSLTMGDLLKSADVFEKWLGGEES